MLHEATALTDNITAITSSIIALGGLVTAITVLIPILRSSRAAAANAAQAAKNAEKAATLGATNHALINNNWQEFRAHQARLEAALVAAGVPVPVDESITSKNV
jgi:urea transporter